MARVFITGSSDGFTGGYFQHQKRKPFNPVAGREEVQEQLMDYLRDLTGFEIA